MLENVGQARAASSNQIGSGRANQIAGAKDCVARVQQGKAGSSPELVELMKIKAALRRPEKLQSHEPARPGIQHTLVVLSWKVLKQFSPIGKCRNGEALLARQSGFCGTKLVFGRVVRQVHAFVLPQACIWLTDRNEQCHGSSS
jgi:hypothetical protein